MNRQVVRAELRKLTSTRMPLAFLFVLVAFSAVTAIAVVFGTDADGSKAFVATEADQRSLVGFGFNALSIASLFGAIAVSREYGHGTVVPSYLAAPRRGHAVLAQHTAALVAGVAVGALGAGLTVTAVALALPSTEHPFLLSASAVAGVVTAAGFAGAAGAVLGAGVGQVVRNTGGAVTSVFLLLMVAPSLIVQLVNDASSWIPVTLTTVLSGVTHEIGRPGAALALAAWAAIPAALGLLAVNRRDVV